MKRPIEVTPICLVLIAASALGIFSYGNDRGWIIEFTAVISSAIVFFVVLGFWLGDRWCHRLLAFFACYALIKPVILVAVEPPFFDKVVILFEAGLALPLLVWLFTNRIDGFTQTEDEPNQSDETLDSTLDTRP